MTETTFSGEELEEALLEGDLAQARVNLTGMVKPSETEGHINFSQSGCETWVEVPTAMIEKADLLGHTPCGDHSHPLMRITIKEPEDSESKVLLSLLAQLSPSVPPQPMPMPTVGRGESNDVSALSPSVPPQPVSMQAGSQFRQTGAFDAGALQPSMISQPAPRVSIGPTRPVGPRGHNPCCCLMRDGIYLDYICISCPFGATCECTETGPHCRQIWV